MNATSVCFVVHEARRTGPPLYALGVVGWLAERADLDLDLGVVLARGGPLEGAFARLCPTRVWEADEAGARGLLERADVVVVNTAISTQVLRRAGCRPPRVVTHVHELEVGLRYWLPAEDHRWMLDVTDRFLVGPDCAADNLVRHHGVDRARIGQVPYFVPAGSGPGRRDEVRRHLGVGPDTVLVGACGAREWRKAPDLFAHVAWHARRLAPDVDLRFCWVGASPPSGPHWDEDADLALLDLGDRLRYEADQDDIDPWLAAFDLYALTSREDDFPLACLTAASFGVPPVTFDGGGIADLVRHGGGGTVVPYPRTEALAGALVSFARDPERRAEHGRRLRDHVAEHHRLEQTGARVLDELRAVAAR
ncbi:MAG: glycosyltransferase family 4 protein [Acidimicrobiales bacterium]|nr:glycosyltransferase family 4 protein [Acidimicrobiales bacterium]